VDVDLWNEHLSRYAFAARLAAGKRVLDAGCGTGYGCAALAGLASSVTGLDIAPEAIAHAREHSARPGVTFLEGSCSAMPLPDTAFDLVISFEVIEHLEDWHAFLLESRRVLAPGGVFLLSTPNRDYYAEARRVSGPNPFHLHEFNFDEFESALKDSFPHVHLYLQNHVEGIAFQPAPASGQGLPELRQADSAPDPQDAHFFLAACSQSPLPPPAPFVYVPTTANVLHERELHIAKLEVDVEQLRGDKEKLVEMFRIQKTSLEEGNRWSSSLDEKLKAASARIVELQEELKQTTAGFEAQVATLASENRAKTEWSQQLDQKLKAASARIVKLQEELKQTSAGFETQLATLAAEDRAKTKWSRQLDQKLKAASARIVELQEELKQTSAGFETQLATLAGEDRAKTEWSRKLDEELAAASGRIVELQEELKQTAAGFEAQVATLEGENRVKTEWSRKLDEELAAASARIVELQEELKQTAAGFEAQVATLEGENRVKTEWSRKLDEELAAASARIVELQEELKQTATGFQAQVATLEGENHAKTEWAQQLDQNLAAASARIAALERENDAKTEWARQLDQNLAAASARIVELQNELERTAAGFQAQVTGLERENDTKTEWARQLGENLAAASARIIELQNEVAQMAIGYRATQASLEVENRAKAEWVTSLSEALEQSNRKASDAAEQFTTALAQVFDLEAQLSRTATSNRSRLDSLQAEICAQTKWGQKLTADLEEGNRRSQELEEAVARYAAQLAQVQAENDAKSEWARRLEAENDAKTGWARRLEAELDAKGKDLVHCVDVLHATEKTLAERTARMSHLEERVNCGKASRWVKLGNLLGLGPKFNGE
jgi:SAM-dependent methyltransferase